MGLLLILAGGVIGTLTWNASQSGPAAAPGSMTAAVPTAQATIGTFENTLRIGGTIGAKRFGAIRTPRLRGPRDAGRSGLTLMNMAEGGAIHIEVGDIVVEETQEVFLDGQDTFSVSYQPPVSLVGDDFGWGEGNGYYTELTVTVTDTSTGASYTTTYDRTINLYRCPYGIVYNQKTGQPIVGATVTIHNADGSIVMLDKAANPNVSNPQTTDATGRYNAKLAIGKKYYLTVKAPGYDEYRSEVFSERWHIVREDVGLSTSTVLSKK